MYLPIPSGPLGTDRRRPLLHENGNGRSRGLTLGHPNPSSLVFLRENLVLLSLSSLRLPPIPMGVRTQGPGVWTATEGAKGDDVFGPEGDRTEPHRRSESLVLRRLDATLPKVGGN